MAAAQQSPPHRTREAYLAGLQAGMLGAFWMLAWNGLAAAWQRRGFWAPENLLASVFHPHAEIRLDFGPAAISGLALYLTVYSLLGAGFAAVAGSHPMRHARTVLLAVVTALAWYYFSFYLLWKTISPAIGFLNAGEAAVVGHIIYGLVLGRFHAHMPLREQPVAQTVGTETESRITAPSE